MSDGGIEIAFIKLAGIPGFEPGNARIKTWCLTAWRYPNKELADNFSSNQEHGAEGET